MVRSMATIPDSHRNLLEGANIAHLGTVRPDGLVHVNPMWFLFDGENVRFTHTRKRGKFRNLQENPAMTISVVDPDDEYRYLEVRGRLSEIVDDPTGAFYQELERRYSGSSEAPPPDAADRVILVMTPEATSTK